MPKAIPLLLALATLTACAEYQGQKTNCWSGGTMSLVQSDTVTRDCTDWTVIGG